MATLTSKITEKQQKEFPNRNLEEINAISWLAVQNETKPEISNSIHQSDEELIISMKEIDKVYIDNYEILKEFKDDSRVLQSKLEAIIFN